MAVNTICKQGAQSVAGIQIADTELRGTLPDIFDSFPDLQILDFGANRGAGAPHAGRW
jgi:hypothetical protein